MDLGDPIREHEVMPAHEPVPAEEPAEAPALEPEREEIEVPA